MHIKFLAALAASALAFTAAVPAHAVVTIGSSSVNKPIIVHYNGFKNKDGLGGTLPGLTAKSIFTLTGITGSLFTFSFSIANTSGGDTDASRVSIFGFNTSKPGTGALLMPSLVFTQRGAGKNVPNLSGPDNNRICFRAGGGGMQCSGGGGGGVAMGDPAATGNFTLGFAPGVTTFDLDQFYIRYQSVKSDAYSATSATGVGSVMASVPEPSTWMMMIFGFGFIGATMRKKAPVRLIYA